MARLSMTAILVWLVQLHFAASSLLADSAEPISPLLVRAEMTKWPLPTTNPPPRIERDEHGRIVELWLDGVKLEAGDIDIIRSFKELRRLGLSYTTISDQELAGLADLPRLEGIRLNYTAIGDEGVASLAKFPKLKSACLFRIPATPQAVQALKRERKQLSIGYGPLAK